MPLRLLGAAGEADTSFGPFTPLHISDTIHIQKCWAMDRAMRLLT